MTPARALEQNLDRVVDSVLRSLVPGREAEAADPEAGSDETTARQIMADLCGHVAFALRSLDAAPPPHGVYHGNVPALPVEHPMLDVRR